jgi:hypothetical protein
MAATKTDWTRGYARQALSDLRAREALVQSNAEKCHRLHYLQMAAEKACKAHLIAASGHESVKKSHAYIEKTLPLLARHFYSEVAEWEIKQIKWFAREIQLLAPACGEGEYREDNSEYPWEDAKGEICIPCEYKFPHLDDGNRAIVRLIRLIQIAARSYSQDG